MKDEFIILELTLFFLFVLSFVSSLSRNSRRHALNGPFNVSTHQPLSAAELFLFAFDYIPPTIRREIYEFAKLCSKEGEAWGGVAIWGLAYLHTYAHVGTVVRVNHDAVMERTKTNQRSAEPWTDND